MIFDVLDRRMRVFETAADYCVLPGIYMVARLDGRSFTRLTKIGNRFEAPFDASFRDLMVQTAEGLMNCGFRVVYAFTESDEISLLLALDEDLFGRKLRKYDSTLAGEASARFSIALGQPATFDCRISQLPSVELVVDYFRWRSEDAARNALNAYCYWTLRKQGQSEQVATGRLEGLSVAAKNELLFQSGVNFNDVPKWQKRGIGLYWETYEKSGYDPRSGASAIAKRRRIAKNFDLPMKEEYGEFVRRLALASTDK
jgi:tRNA(His) guanylyltransferase